jgi:ABC-2 type transport system permease protein
VTIYFDIIRFSFLRFFAYPFEILATTLKRVFEIAFLIIFWTIYIKSSGVQLSISQITAYFLIAMGVADLTMARWGALSSMIGNQVKSGGISNYIIKPTQLIPTLYAMALGRNGMRLILAAMNVIIGFWIMPPNSVMTLFVFVLFLINAWAISFAYNILEGSLFLHFTDASGIRNSLQNFIRILTGTMVPLYMFPSPLKEILRFTPFPSMVYLAANSVSSTLIPNEVITDLCIGLFWAVTLNIAASSFWNYSMKKYEAVGI